MMHDLNYVTITGMNIIKGFKDKRDFYIDDFELVVERKGGEWHYVHPYYGFYKSSETLEGLAREIEEEYIYLYEEVYFSDTPKTDVLFSLIDTLREMLLTEPIKEYTIIDKLEENE